ncbi:MAG: hypothetical protein ABEJ03_04010 [Candidatus Nanohaloarchaea archaeon]
MRREEGTGGEGNEKGYASGVVRSPTASGPDPDPFFLPFRSRTGPLSGARIRDRRGGSSGDKREEKGRRRNEKGKAANREWKPATVYTQS